MKFIVLPTKTAISYDLIQYITTVRSCSRNAHSTFHKYCPFNFNKANTITMNYIKWLP